MRYVSTRGGAPALGFADVLLGGLAPDGGLYVPETWPKLPPLSELAELDYPQLATELMWPFIRTSEADDGSPAARGRAPVDDASSDASGRAVGGDGSEISRADLEAICRAAYATFDTPQVCPVRRVGELWLMELFHGPTLAFKDVALQVVGRLFDHVLTSRGSRVTILGATSGDTGSAAMSAFGGLGHSECVILFPHGRTSEVQRRQMTTIGHSNCHAVAVAGTFDDCQDLVKAAFGDAAFRDEVRLGAVNSINWARVMAQIVYYVWAHLRVSPDGTPVSFCVPTGNFGNVLAGWVAKQMGLPVHRLVVASNRNDILTRALTGGDLSVREVVPTTSPSMDIQVSSNFERLLFEVLGRDGAATAEMLRRFRSEGAVSIDAPMLEVLRRDFDAGRLDDEEVASVIAQVHRDHDLFVDPHTAVGIGVGRALAGGSDNPLVCLATAHPAKFPDAVLDATGVHPPMPQRLAQVFDRPERVLSVDDDLQAVQELVRRVLADRR